MLNLSTFDLRIRLARVAKRYTLLRASKRPRYYNKRYYCDLESLLQWQLENQIHQL